VIDGILHAVPRPAGSGAPLDRFRDWAVAARAALGASRGLAHHLLLHWFESPTAIDIVESLLEVAAAADLDGFAQVAAANAVFMYVLMRVEAETSVRSARVVTRTLRPVTRDPARYPLAHRNVAEFNTARLDDHFAYGLDLLLAGIGAADRDRRGAAHAAAR
jgi:hypothetical protein